MTYYDPTEHMDEAGRVDFEVRQHLYAQRRLREIDEIDTKARVAKMLAEVVPKRQVCSMFLTEGAVEGEKAKRVVCGKPGVRMLALTGDWCCADHDPLRHELVRCTNCNQPLEVCRDRSGPWVCSAGARGHGWPHRHTILGGDPWE